MKKVYSYHGKNERNTERKEKSMSKLATFLILLDRLNGF